MSELLNHKLSLLHEIKTVMLPHFGYITDVEGEELAVYTGDELLDNTYEFSLRNVAYADASGRINPSGVSIYDGARQLALEEFTVNYILNIVTLDVQPSGTVTADYSSYQVSVIDAFPTYEEFEAMDLPVVSIDLDEQTDSPFAIGQQESWWRKDFFIDIFATNDAMRIDLMDRLQKSLKKWIPILDFSEQPINYDGTINTDFDWQSQFEYWMKIRGKTRGTLINDGTLDSKERFRASIMGSLTSVNQ